MPTVKDERAKLQAQLRAKDFAYSNGLVLRFLNLLYPDYVPLSRMYDIIATHKVEQDEYLKSISFLADEEYIYLRSISGKARASLADNDYTDLEAYIAPKGTRLLNGEFDDRQIEV